MTKKHNPHNINGYNLLNPVSLFGNFFEVIAMVLIHTWGLLRTPFSIAETEERTSSQPEGLEGENAEDNSDNGTIDQNEASGDESVSSGDPEEHHENDGVEGDAAHTVPEFEEPLVAIGLLGDANSLVISPLQDHEGDQDGAASGSGNTVAEDLAPNTIFVEELSGGELTLEGPISAEGSIAVEPATQHTPGIEDETEEHHEGECGIDEAPAENSLDTLGESQDALN
jgi:hypothetical protein